MNNLYKRSLLRLMDLTSVEIHKILKLASYFKQQKRTEREIQLLNKKNIALIFEKDSTRTRCSFEVAAFDQGAHVTYIGPSGSQISNKESIKDTARVLGRMYNAIQYRGYDQKIVEKLSKYSGVPVWNGLTNSFHPTQLLADLLTIKEQFKEKNLKDIKLAYVGDAHNNISNTLLEAAAIIGFDLRLIAPKAYWPNKEILNYCCNVAKKNNGKITITDDITSGVYKVDFIYTDVWVSMGEDKSIWKERISLLYPYQVNMKMLKSTFNYKVKFLHCLPAFHNYNTIIGKNIIKKYRLSNGIEVTDEVFESMHSVVFDQAENRMHTIKAIMVATINKFIPNII